MRQSGRQTTESYPIGRVLTKSPLKKRDRLKVKRSGSTKLLQRVVARTAQVARSKLVERTGVQGFHLVTLHRHLRIKLSYFGRAPNSLEGFTLSGQRREVGLVDVR